MISYKTKEDKEEEIFELLNPIVRDWFRQKFKTFSPPQKFAITEIHSRQNVLVSAPTGTGKTLCLFLSILNELIDSSQKGILQNKIYAVYTSPLKSLNSDISLNLKGPLEEMEKIARKKFGIRISVRTGDTTTAERQKMLKTPPHILITTPESLSILLASPKFKDHLKNVDFGIIDEVHSLAENKRGTQLSLAFERLQYLSLGMARIGASATIEPLEEIAKFVAGSKRDCKIINTPLIKQLDLKVLSPSSDLIEEPFGLMHQKMYELLDGLIQKHKTTLIFTNTRSATERVVHHLKDKFPKNYTENIGAHHGSLSKEHRLDIEKRMRDGKMKCVVSSTSLELGLDIGYIDLVILLGSPKSVARFVQRIGRSCHQLNATIKGRVIVLDRDDLIECSVMAKNALENKIDKIHIPKNSLDVLAQEIYGMANQQIWEEKELFKLIKNSYCYEDLSKKDFDDVLSYLDGSYTSLEDRHVYAKIWRNEGKIGKKGKLSRVIYMTNIGTIPDETAVTVKIGERKIGYIEEAFLERLKRNDLFVLGGQVYQFLFARGMVAQVQASPGRPPTVPAWFSEMLPLSFDLANDIGKFRRLIEQKFENKKSKDEMIDFISEYLYTNRQTSTAIYNYMKEQYDYCKHIPNDKKILIEQFKDERGNKKIIFHTMFGRRVNDCLSRAVAFAISRLEHKDVEIGINDNGFYISSSKPINALRALQALKSKELRKILEQAIEKTEIFRRRFRHCATRSLMILRQYKGRKKRVGRQQVSSMILMSALKRISDDFSILKEAKREVLEDLMDVDHTIDILKNIEDGKIELKAIFTEIPSPFSFNLILQAHLDVLKIEDKIEFLKRMHSQVLAKISLNK
ncbi:ATP-dependent helicase [Candidatus Woesearchaeota archaeon]|nr:ATP-dependent helicase [Candidatus Woesearchaeota archaeon]